MTSAFPSLSVVVPVYNERGTVREVIERVLDRPEVWEIIIVDDCSTDGTDDVLRDLEEQHAGRLRVFRHRKNSGKGAALRMAFRHVRSDWTIVQDADFEYDPADYPLLLDRVRVADVVYGSRFLGRPLRFSLHTTANKILTWLSNLVTGLHLTDMETCYKLMPSAKLRRLPLRSRRFDVEPEITALLAKRGCRFAEVPIRYRARSHAEGKKIRWWDGFAAVVAILRFGIFG